jgi:chaperonin GroEL
VSELKGYKYGNKIVDIRPTGRITPMQCIKVSNPDHLYVTDNFIVTHNTTTATILAAAMVLHIYEYCRLNPRMSPQKVARDLSKVVRTKLVPSIQNKAILIDIEKNIELLRMVAKVSANGDDDMADAVIQAFEKLGYGDNAHITIKQISGPYGYDVGLIEGFPIPIGYEESAGKFHNMFVNDQANQRCYLEKPLFLLYDGQLNDMVTVQSVMEKIGDSYGQGNTEHRNVVIVAHGFSASVLATLSVNFVHPDTIKVLPISTPRAPFLNAETHFLSDLSAFTGAKVFGLRDRISDAKISDLGVGSEYFEAYRYRSTLVANPDSINIEVRADELKVQKKNAESKQEALWLEERIGKLTSGIARLTISGGSNGELKEAHDRCEDAVCAVRSAIAKGALPGGCRTMLDLAAETSLDETIPDHVKDILIPSLYAPILRLLDNAGYKEGDVEEIIARLQEEPNLVYDVENQEFGDPLELGVFDCLPAVEEALKNATSIAAVMGTIGGIVAYPRDENAEREEAAADSEYRKMSENPTAFTNEANERI